MTDSPADSPVAIDGGRKIGPHLLGVTVTWRYRVEWLGVRAIVRTLFRMEVQGL